MADRLRHRRKAIGRAARAGCVASALVAAGLPWSGPLAQETIIVGERGGGAVTVDMSVLDELGPSPTVPDLLMPNRPAPAVAPEERGRLTLRPPRGAQRSGGAATTAAASAPGSVKLKPPASSQPRTARVAPARTPPRATPPPPPPAPRRVTAPAATELVQPSPPRPDAASPTPGPSVVAVPPAMPTPPGQPEPVAPAVTPPAPPAPAASTQPPPAPPSPPPVAAPQPSAAPPGRAAAVAPRPASEPQRPAQRTVRTAEPKPPVRTTRAVEPPPIAAPAAAPAPPPPPPAAAAPRPQIPAQTAALAPGRVPPEGTPLAVVFPAESSNLAEPSKAALDAVAQRMDQDESLRLQLLAYAGGNDETASRARRLSLSRALAVRSYLIDRGVRSTRIDVRALGNRSEGGSPDRVDVIVVAR